MSKKKQAKGGGVTIRMDDGPEITVSDLSAIAQDRRMQWAKTLVDSIDAPVLRAVAAQAVLDLADSLAAGEADISETITRLADEREGEQELKLALGFKITWNLDGNSVDTVLSWTVKNKIEASHDLSEADQPPLPGM